MELYFITGNKHKFNEAQSIIGGLKQFNIELDEIQEVDTKKIIEHKLREALKHKRANFIVEDASLHFECLGNLPGPLIKWFWKSLGNVGLYDLCRRYRNFNATASVTIGYTDGQEIKYFSGSIKGKIVKPTGENGFGYDPIFIPQGFKKTYHEMTDKEKNSVSHRRRALDKLKKFLANR
ncbi:non-canonical purine NTP pyrophosphatase [bacterium]|nr:non-canonical purine NTP pyrophosphatase [bacterium]